MPSFSIPAAGVAAGETAGALSLAATTAAAESALATGALTGVSSLAATGAATTAAAGSSLASTLATVGTIGSALSAGVGAYGALSTAAASKASANYRAQVAKNNQILAGRNEAMTSEQAQANLETQGLRSRQVMGDILTKQAASNIDINSGSTVDVRASQHELDMLDALTIRSNAEKQIYGYQIQGGNFGGEAALESSQAASAGTAGAIGATSSILSGATSVANQYLNWQREGGTVKTDPSPQPLFAR